jgi:hypothetical protein
LWVIDFMHFAFVQAYAFSIVLFMPSRKCGSIEGVSKEKQG